MALKGQKSPGPRGKTWKHMTPTEKRRMRQIREDGYTIASIARKFKRSYTSVSRLLNKLEDHSIPTMYQGVDTRANLPQQALYIEENPPPKAYVWQLYPEADAIAFHDGTLTPERARELAATVPEILALKDFEVFLERYEATKLVPHQRAWIAHMLAHFYAAVFAPPGSGKSYLFSVFLVCWLLAGGGRSADYYDDPASPLRNVQILLVAQSEEQSKKNMEAVKARLTENQKLVQAFGRFRGPDLIWQTGKIQVDGRERHLKTGDPSLYAVGASTALMGFRADWQIWDDFASLTNCATPDQTDKLMEWMADTAHTRLNPGGRIFSIMARLPKPNDPSVRLENQGLDDPDDEDEEDDEAGALWSCMVSPAVVDYATKEKLWGDHPGFLTWRELIARRKSMGRSHFETMFNQVRYSGTQSLAKREWIYGEGDNPGCLDHDRGIGASKKIIVRGEKVPTVRVMTMDPSPTKYAAAHVMDIPKLGRARYAPQLLDIERSKMRSPDMIALMNRWHDLYGYQVLIFEQNAAQRWLMDNPDWQAFQRRTRVKLIGHQTTGANKPDPDYGMQSLAGDIEAGNIRIPYGDPEARAKYQILIKEMLEEANTDDTLMALWFPKWVLGGLQTIGGGSSGWQGYGRGPIGPPPRLTDVNAKESAA